MPRYAVYHNVNPWEENRGGFSIAIVVTDEQNRFVAGQAIEGTGFASPDNFYEAARQTLQTYARKYASPAYRIHQSTGTVDAFLASNPTVLH